MSVCKNMFLVVISLPLGSLSAQWRYCGAADSTPVVAITSVEDKMIAVTHRSLVSITMNVQRGVPKCTTMLALPGEITCACGKDSLLYLGCAEGKIFLHNTHQPDTVSLVYDFGSPVSCIVLKGGVLYVGLDPAGVFYSSDGGRSWVDLPVEPTVASPIVAAEGDTSVFIGTKGAGVLRLRNGTNIWSPNTGLVNLNVYAIRTWRSLVLSGTADGSIYYSTDDGMSWTLENQGLPYCPILSLTDFPRAIFAGTWGWGIYVSSNAGSSWSEVNEGLDNDGALRVHALTICDLTMYAGTESGIWWRPLGEMISLIPRDDQFRIPEVTWSP